MSPAFLGKEELFLDIRDGVCYNKEKARGEPI